MVKLLQCVKTLSGGETLAAMNEAFNPFPEEKRADDIRQAFADRLEFETSRHIATEMIEGEEGCSEPTLGEAR